MSDSNSEATKHTRANCFIVLIKNINNVGFYWTPSHGVRSRFLSEFENKNTSFSSREMNVLCGDIIIEI